MKHKQSILLVLISSLFGWLLCEAGLRLFTPYGRTRSLGRPLVATQTSNKPLDATDAMYYVTKLAAAEGTDRRWFLEDPPALPNRSAPRRELVERYHDFERRGIFPPQGNYIFNRYYVESERCRSDGLFHNYPDHVLAFEPPVVDFHPRYRFPPATTAFEGLVTNEFGLRGGPLTLAKPARTVRIAFAGASTTINHDLLFSYPERVVYWLNRFAAANRYDVRFEALNGGREGINSTDIAAIVRQELLPLDPDLAVYYEGSNQFPAANQLVSPRIAPRQEIDPRDPIAGHKVPEMIRAHLATGDLLDRALNRFSPVGEPRRPFYRLQWPAGVDEQNPEVDSPGLPLQLPVIVKDLDSIRTSMESIGGRLVLCSFVWLAEPGMPLSPTRHEHIYKQLNTVLWPLSYADIRRLADFQNRVFCRYAAARGVALVDLASAMPQDPDLFADAIHPTDAGARLLAWIVFQRLVPLVRRQIESGQLPRPAGSRPLPPPPSLAAKEISTRCEDPSGPFVALDGAVSLDALKLAYQDASIERGHPVKIITSDQRWAYAASLPIRMPQNLTAPSYLFLRARVLKGQIGLGVLDSDTDAFQLEKMLSPSSGMTNIYVPVLFPERARAMIIRNVAEGNVRSEILIEDAAVVVPSRAAKK